MSEVSGRMLTLVRLPVEFSPSAVTNSMNRERKMLAGMRGRLVISDAKPFKTHSLTFVLGTSSKTTVTENEFQFSL